jgi:hypothetical protein
MESYYPCNSVLKIWVRKAEMSLGENKIKVYSTN